MEPIFRHFLLRYLNFKGYKNKISYNTQVGKNKIICTEKKKKKSGSQMSPLLDSNAGSSI